MIFLFMSTLFQRDWDLLSSSHLLKLGIGIRMENIKIISIFCVNCV